MKNGLILQSEALPNGAKILGDKKYKGREWFKIKGDLDQTYVDNWLRFKGEFFSAIETLKTREREWRDSELSRTDLLIILDDYPKKIELTAYRSSLREYPESKDFPNGKRPNIEF